MSKIEYYWKILSANYIKETDYLVGCTLCADCNMSGSVTGFKSIGKFSYHPEYNRYNCNEFLNICEKSITHDWTFERKYHYRNFYKCNVCGLCGTKKGIFDTPWIIPGWPMYSCNEYLMIRANE